MTPYLRVAHARHRVGRDVGLGTTRINFLPCIIPCGPKRYISFAKPDSAVAPVVLG
jgi:hypothetical protein